MNSENSALTTRLGKGLLKSVSNPPAKLLILLAILLLALALRSYPLFLQSFPDPDFYYHSRMSQLAYQQGGVPTYDSLSYGGRQYTYYPFHHASIAFLAKATGTPVETILPIATLIIALLAVIATYLLAQRLFGEKAGILTALAAAVHSGFVARSAAFARPDEYALLLIPLSLLLLLQENKLSYALLFVLFAFFPLVHLPAAVVGLFIFAICTLAARGKTLESAKKIAAALLGMLAGSTYYFGWDFKQLIASKGFAASAEMAALDFSFLIFYSGVLLVFAGVAAWEISKKLALKDYSGGQMQNAKLLLAWLATTFLLQLAANRNVIFFAPAICVAAGIGMKHALEKSGKYEKHLLTITLLALAISSATFLSVQQPGFSANDVEAAKWLGENSKGGLVAAHWDRGHLLTAYGSRVVADGYFEYAPSPEKKVAALEQMLASGDASQVLSLAVQNGVEFVFLDEASLAQLAENSVWRSAPAGFEKAFDKGAQVWRLKEKLE